MNNQEVLNKLRRFAVRRTIRSLFNDVKYFANKPINYLLWRVHPSILGRWVNINSPVPLQGNGANIDKELREYMSRAEFKDIIRQIVFEILQENESPANAELAVPTIDLGDMQNNYFSSSTTNLEKFTSCNDD